MFVACAVCFGGGEGSLLSAARVGVLFMAAVTCGVLAAFALFFLRLKKGDSPLFLPQEKGTAPLLEKGTVPFSLGDR